MIQITYQTYCMYIYMYNIHVITCTLIDTTPWLFKHTFPNKNILTNKLYYNTCGCWTMRWGFKLLNSNKLFHCVPSSIPEYTYSRQELVVYHSLNHPANLIIFASSSTTDVSKCVYWIDPQPVTVSSQRGESHFVHGILNSVQ